MRSPRITITWLCFGASERGSISVPARMTVTWLAALKQSAQLPQRNKTLRDNRMTAVAFISIALLCAMVAYFNSAAIIASASISTSISGETIATTWTHGCRRTNVAEHFAVRPPDFLPAADVDYEHPRPHHIAQTRSGIAPAHARCSSTSALPERTYHCRRQSFRPRRWPPFPPPTRTVPPSPRVRILLSVRRASCRRCSAVPYHASY